MRHRKVLEYTSGISHLLKVLKRYKLHYLDTQTPRPYGTREGGVTWLRDCQVEEGNSNKNNP